MKEKTKGKLFNDKEFADLYFSILGDSMPSNRTRLLLNNTLDKDAFHKALKQYSAKAAEALLEKFKDKLV